MSPGMINTERSRIPAAPLCSVCFFVEDKGEDRLYQHRGRNGDKREVTRRRLLDQSQNEVGGREDKDNDREDADGAAVRVRQDAENARDEHDHGEESARQRGAPCLERGRMVEQFLKGVDQRVPDGAEREQDKTDRDSDADEGEGAGRFLRGHSGGSFLVSFILYMRGHQVSSRKRRRLSPASR